MPTKLNKKTISQIFSLKGEEKNISQISKILDLDRSTVRHYLSLDQESAVAQAPDEDNLIKLIQQSPADYAYILGLYLGDGTISKNKGKEVYKLRIFLDAKYPKLNENCKSAMQRLFSVNKVNSTIKPYKGKPSLEEIYVYSKKMPEAFPQHGPGMKHTRKIELLEWQEEILDKYPKHFLRGLLQSDGSRYVVQNEGRSLVAYNFTNVSIDIIRIFERYCLKVGITTRINNKSKSKCYVATVYKKAFVQILDEFVGPKADPAELPPTPLP